MRTPLDKVLRSKLEKTVEQARDIVELAVAEALTRLGVTEASAPSYLSETERKLRTRLRAHGRQLGDVLSKDSGKQETALLVNEMAYEHWHRMLFARFLEQSDLLMYEPGTHVTLDECFELAEEEDDCKDGWELAGQLAQKMLPQIFRADSPVFEIKLSINHVNALEELIAALHTDTFQASDSLGWCYQFWQNKKKKQVNESGIKIGAKELSAVTQLFTEPYMVSFLLDNALGAWWAKRRLTKDDLQTAISEQELRELAAIPGVPLEYLRFIKDEENGIWKSAVGDFDKWPEHLCELKTLDPCCGSGHFLVAKFLMLVPIRMELEGLNAKETIDLVLAQNIHGLELDQRCVELAAFALAFEAWRYPGSGGYRHLPELQLACTGLSIIEAQKEWKDLAKDDEELEGAIQWMLKTFKDAPTLGSLISPFNSLNRYQKAPWKTLYEAINDSSIGLESKVNTKGLVKSAELLSNKFSWVVTNVPYLVRNKMSDILGRFCDENFPAAKADLANIFLDKTLGMLRSGGVSQLVMTQNWMFLNSYKHQRKRLLSEQTINMVLKLGGGAECFQNGPGNIVNIACVTLSNDKNSKNQIAGFDVQSSNTPGKKADLLKEIKVSKCSQVSQLNNPDATITLDDSEDKILLNQYSNAYWGQGTGDFNRFGKYWWEVPSHLDAWTYGQSTVKETCHYSGRIHAIFWENGKGQLVEMAEAQKLRLKNIHYRGAEAWNKKGISITQMGELRGTLYTGNIFDGNCSSITPKNESELMAIWAYCSSKGYNSDVRKVDQSLKVTNKNLLKVAFDIDYWSSVAQETYPYGLPEPYSNDTIQWIFHGHPCASVVWNEDIKKTCISALRQDETVLQVAVARLLGFRWPAELDAEMELAPEMREVLAKSKDFDGLVDDDGIVCIPAIRGEKPADDRLEAILHAAYGNEWSATVLNNLLKSVKSINLSTWLRDKFFEQHCKLFQHRPFIWHVWDGLADGFSALVNYHTLDYKGLERLIYTYLDDWISTQIQLEKDGVEGAELRLTAARNLKQSLEAILVGEKGLDIFVRWKSLAEQPIGWNPDLNDGVRLNIRPFMKVKDVGKKEAGVLRSKPNIHWKKDRGTDVDSAPWFDLGLEYGGKQGDRINDHHVTLAEKKAARSKLKEES